MIFKKNILNILSSYSQPLSEMYIDMLDKIIYILCIRILVVLNLFTEHAKETIIHTTFLKQAIDIELELFTYNDTKTKDIDNHTNDIYVLFKKNEISKLDITSECLEKINYIIHHLIYYFLNESIEKNSFSCSKLLNTLKINNYFLYKFIIEKYNYKKI